MKSVFIYTMILGVCFFLKFKDQDALAGGQLCGNYREDMVNIRFENSSPYDFNKIKVYNDGKEIVLNGLESGQRSCFEAFMQTSLLPRVELQIMGETYRIAGSLTHTIMNESLERGYYNCRINVAGEESNKLTLEINRL